MDHGANLERLAVRPLARAGRRSCAARPSRPHAAKSFDGRAWLGITPFMLSGLRLRSLPSLRGLCLSRLNVPHVCHARRSARRLLLQPRCGKRPRRGRRLAVCIRSLLPGSIHGHERPHRRRLSLSPDSSRRPACRVSARRTDRIGPIMTWAPGRWRTGSPSADSPLCGHSSRPPAARRDPPSSVAVAVRRGGHPLEFDDRWSRHPVASLGPWSSISPNVSRSTCGHRRRSANCDVRRSISPRTSPDARRFRTRARDVEGVVEHRLDLSASAPSFPGAHEIARR